MPEFGFTNTIIHAQSDDAFQNPKIADQYAAMPSLHFGWDLLVAIAIGTQVRFRGLKLSAAFMPLLMLSGIVMTANHYFLDAAAGGAVSPSPSALPSGCTAREPESFFSFLGDHVR